MGTMGKTVTIPDTVAVVKVGVVDAVAEVTDAATELAAAEIDAVAGVGTAVAGRGMITGVIGETVTGPVG